MNSDRLDTAFVSAANSMLLVIDMQERLLPAIHDHYGLRDRVACLAQSARLLSVPVWATEHWPEKIGATHPGLVPHIDHTIGKTHFDACRESGFTAGLPGGRTRVLLAGIESHICVLQTGLGLARAGLQPVLVADAMGSRHESDRRVALQRWQHYGLEVASMEMVLYEWLETPANPAFREILALVKDL